MSKSRCYIYAIVMQGCDRFDSRLCSRNKFCKNYPPKALITLMYNPWVIFLLLENTFVYL